MKTLFIGDDKIADIDVRTLKSIVAVALDALTKQEEALEFDAYKLERGQQINYCASKAVEIELIKNSLSAIRNKQSASLKLALNLREYQTE